MEFLKSEAEQSQLSKGRSIMTDRAKKHELGNKQKLRSKHLEADQHEKICMRREEDHQSP